MSQFQFDTYTSDQITQLQSLLQSKGVTDPDIAAFLTGAATNADFREFDTETAINQAGNAAAVAVSGTPTIATATHTPAIFTAQDWVATGVARFDPSTPTVVTIQQSGVYIVTANVAFPANGTGFREIDVLLNGASGIANDTVGDHGGGDHPRLSAAGSELLAEGDVITLDLYQNSGGNLTLDLCRLRVVQFGPTGVSATTL